jgi:CheY-like chemotaxis protein
VSETLAARERPELTAKAMKDDHDRCLEAGANDYMPKPLDVERLLSLLRIWLSKTGGRAA